MQASVSGPTGVFYRRVGGDRRRVDTTSLARLGSHAVMLRFGTACAVVALWFCGACGGGASADSAAAIAYRDVEAVHRLLQDEHPGAFDEHNPQLRSDVEAGFREAQIQLPWVSSRGGHIAVLRRYLTRFRDGHVGLHAEPLPGAWPSFIVALRAGRYVVSESDATAGAPPVGAVVVACDGRSLADRMRNDVFAYAGDPALEAHWVRLAPNALVDLGNPFVARAERCELEVSGERRTHVLRWQPIDGAALRTKLTAAAFGEAPSAGARTLADGTVWVSVPSFGNPLSVRPLIDQAASWRAAPRIVLDVRGNTGGSSSHGLALAKGLWGEPFVEDAYRRAMRDRPPIVIDWRASQAVQTHVEGLAALHPAFAAAARGIAEARAAHRPLFSQPEPPLEPPSATPIEPATQARVFFLTDGRCASACLDFADLLLRVLPGVVHVGAPTSADTEYMEVRRVALPSGLGVILPTKIWRNRARGREPYVPAHRFAGELGDTPALERWIGGLAL